MSYALRVIHHATITTNAPARALTRLPCKCFVTKVLKCKSLAAPVNDHQRRHSCWLLRSCIPMASSADATSSCVLTLLMTLRIPMSPRGEARVSRIFQVVIQVLGVCVEGGEGVDVVCGRGVKGLRLCVEGEHVHLSRIYAESEDSCHRSADLPESVATAVAQLPCRGCGCTADPKAEYMVQSVGVSGGIPHTFRQLRPFIYSRTSAHSSDRRRRAQSAARAVTMRAYLKPC
eukprot:365861-Chlamydomonas_euryale.AAC.10